MVQLGPITSTVMGRVCIGRVGYGPSLLCVEFVMGRVCHVPSLLCAELSLNIVKHTYTALNLHVSVSESSRVQAVKHISHTCGRDMYM